MFSIVYKSEYGDLHEMSGIPDVDILKSELMKPSGKWTDSHLAPFYSPEVRKALYTTCHIHPVTNFL